MSEKLEASSTLEAAQAAAEEVEYAVSCGNHRHDCDIEQPNEEFGVFRDLETAEYRAERLGGRVFQRVVNPWTAAGGLGGVRP